MNSEGALVLLSGGQDSTVCLAWALDRFSLVETVGFDYGQRHRVELQCRLQIREKILKDFPQWQGRLGCDHVIDLDALKAISSTSLTDDVAIEMNEDGLPNSFVPGRNLIFLTFAGAVAYRRGLKHIIGGMCETDYSGYPDCRDDTLKAMQVALNLGMNRRFVLQTPLMWLDKAATWQLAEEIGGRALTSLIQVDTHTCYVGNRSDLHEWGYGCGTCPACSLREAGYMRWRSAQKIEKGLK